MQDTDGEQHTSMQWMPPSGLQSNCEEPTLHITPSDATRALERVLEKPMRYYVRNRTSHKQRRTEQRGGVSWSIPPPNISSSNDAALDSPAATQRNQRTSSLEPSSGHPLRTSEYLNSARSSPRPRQAPGTPYGEDLRSCASSPTLSDAAFSDSRMFDGRGQLASPLSQGTASSPLSTLSASPSIGFDKYDAEYTGLVKDHSPKTCSITGPLGFTEDNAGFYSIERGAEVLFSAEHLKVILDDPKALFEFTEFLSAKRPQSIRTLAHYFDAQKALCAISYSNALVQNFDAGSRSKDALFERVSPTRNRQLTKTAHHALKTLADGDLHAYVAYSWSRIISASIGCRIMGTRAGSLRAVEYGLTEAFCLTDPTRPNNPIILVSDEFSNMTQYSKRYAIGRNCRFLQGNGSSPASVKRLAVACDLGRGRAEILVNYRRDGSAFLNFLTMAPLRDDRGAIRYYIGAQVDVSRLLKDCVRMDSLAKLVNRDGKPSLNSKPDESECIRILKDLCRMFDATEVATVHAHAGSLYREYINERSHDDLERNRKRILIQDDSHAHLDGQEDSTADVIARTTEINAGGQLGGIFDHYLLIRPSRPFRVLFASRSLQSSGVLQHQFLHRVGGNKQARHDIGTALAGGSRFTAKIYWLYRPDEHGEGDGEARWISCTPLLHSSGAVGMYMVMLVDGEKHLVKRYGLT